MVAAGLHAERIWDADVAAFPGAAAHGVVVIAAADTVVAAAPNTGGGSSSVRQLPPPPPHRDQRCHSPPYHHLHLRACNRGPYVCRAKFVQYVDSTYYDSGGLV